MGWGVSKKVDLSSTQGALCTVSVFFKFLHFTYLGAGCIRTQRTPAYGHVIVCAACVKIIRALHAGRALERGHGI